METFESYIGLCMLRYCFFIVFLCFFVFIVVVSAVVVDTASVAVVVDPRNLPLMLGQNQFYNC